MSKRVSIYVPAEIKQTFAMVQADSPRPTADESTAPTTDAAEAEEASALVKASKTGEGEVETYSEECKRFDAKCPCCHCVAMRDALKRVAFLKTDEGQRRLQMKQHFKSFILDMNAMTHVRKQIECKLLGKQKPDSHTSFPVSITSVERIDGNCMCLNWFVHDETDVAHYEIYVDKRLRKRVFNPKQTSTVVLDVNMKQQHRICLKAVPIKGLGRHGDPIDKIIAEVCSRRMNNTLKGEVFCHCVKKLDKVKQRYKSRNKCDAVDFWKVSTYIYIPACECQEECDCDCLPPTEPAPSGCCSQSPPPAAGNGCA
ncbi:uncharacterized protein LOC108597040 [Drosophila busckii]|nr:uncharacterized protein LOC108597040 [Drosophila busckii]